MGWFAWFAVGGVVALDRYVRVLVVELDGRNLRTGGLRGPGRTGTVRGPTVDQSTSLVHGLWDRSVALFGWQKASLRQKGGKNLLPKKAAAWGTVGRVRRERDQTSIGVASFVRSVR